jgi:hypothetical protein
MDANTLFTTLSDQKEEIANYDIRPLCSRYEESRLNMNSRLAQIVIGVRRCGKSTLCEKVLKQSNIKFAYANFDDDRLATLKTEDLDSVLSALYQIYGDFNYLFLDEIQNVPSWQLFANRLLRQNIHLFITGSNSKLLSKELATHLTGRHNKVELFPFSFSEYAEVRGIDTKSYSVKAQALRKKALNEYLLEGGFPELLHENDKRGYIDSLLNAIIRNDIAKRFKIRHVDVLKRMAVHLADNYCHEFIASDVAELFGISDHTAENYYSYLKEAYLFQGVHKFSFKSRERVTNEKVYVVDIAFATQRESTFSTENYGWRLENTIFLELLRRNRPRYADIFYYKERQWEVDFMVVKDNRIEQLIQVSYEISSEKTLKREITGLVKASEKFRCENLLLITMNGERTIETDTHTINMMTADKWLLNL